MKKLLVEDSNSNLAEISFTLAGRRSSCFYAFRFLALK